MLTGKPVLRRSTAVHEDDVTIREYQHKDHDPVVKLVSDGLMEFAKTYNEQVSTQKYIDTSLKVQLNSIKNKTAKNNLPFNHRFWVAEQGGKVVGTIGLKPTPMQRSDSKASAYIFALSVSSDLRKRGIASKLLNKLEAHCAEAGIEKIKLNTESILTAAIRFYERKGYTRDLKNCKPWGALDLFRYEKATPSLEAEPEVGKKRSHQKAFS